MREPVAALPHGNFFATQGPMACALPSTSRSAWMVQSRHPGRYPKLRSLTLSYPAFEPLTEHHAFSTGFLTAASKSRACPRCPTVLSVCRKQHDKPNGGPKLQTFLILLHWVGRLQDEPTTGSIDHRSTQSFHGVSLRASLAVWLHRHRLTLAAT